MVLIVYSVIMVPYRVGFEAPAEGEAAAGDAQALVALPLGPIEESEDRRLRGVGFKFDGAPPLALAVAFCACNAISTDRLLALLTADEDLFGRVKDKFGIEQTSERLIAAAAPSR